ncbi:MAG TPA: hypothetical protein PLF15_00625 [bacterium]|nr:hypothetical protein [bacterium]
MSQPNKHQHFKMSDENVQHLLKHPGKLALFIGVILTVLICALIVAWGQTKSQKSDSPASSIPQKILTTEELKADYQKSVASIIREYWSKRPDLIAEADICLQTINQTASQLLNLTVTKDFKELQLKLVILLDGDKNNCQTGQEKWPLHSTAAWQDLLDRYPWLIEIE